MIAPDEKAYAYLKALAAAAPEWLGRFREGGRFAARAPSRTAS